MKNILVVLGLIASTGFTVCSVASADTVPSRSEVHQTQLDRLTILQEYTGNNEDGETEEIETKKSK
ncbi:MAG: hypothetical protein ACKPEN_11735 [Planktothrix sp.]|uniref:hypothetical protein n=1 Tax=Planktothrix sp. TaxID=3088171 RepID=UPI0038D3AB95